MLSLLAAAPLALAPLQDATLKPGDPAPALHVAQWVKGDAVPAFEEGKVYVVEFWATWCAPCIASMPHLTDLQTRYGDQGLTIIGVSSVDPRNSLEQVEKMVADKGDGMGYTVAWDDERKTNEAYMQAAGRSGIPCSFLIDAAGKLAYVGHPMWLEMPLEGVLAGTWDPVAGAASVEKLQKEFFALQRIEDPSKALEAMNAFAKDHPAFAHLVEDARIELLLRTGSFEEGYALLAPKVDAAIAAKDAQKLNEYAWLIVDPERDFERKDLDLALRAAEKANALTGAESPAILDTLARVHFLKGDVQKAFELQTKAVDLATGAMKESLRGALEEYRKDLE